MVRTRRLVRSISLACLVFLGAQLGSELSVAYASDGRRAPSFESAAESQRSTCLPSAGRSEALAMSARSTGPTGPDARIRQDDPRPSTGRPDHPIVLQTLHRPPHSLLRQRLRQSARDDVPG